MVKDSVEKPDPIRLKYREQLEELVGTFVREMKPPTAEAIREVGWELGVSSDELNKFTDVTLELLQNLNRGKAGRYRIRPDELKRWKDKFLGQA